MIPPRPWQLVSDDAGFYIADRDGAAVIDVEFAPHEFDTITLILDSVNAYTGEIPSEGTEVPLEGAS